MTRKIKLSAMLFLSVLTVMPQSAHAEKRKLLVGGFQDIIVDGDMKVIVTTGKGPSGIASGDRRILDLLKLDRTSDVMTVRVQRPPNNENGARVSEPLVITLTNQNIRNITVLGNAQLEVSAVDQLGVARIFMNGGGSVNIGQYKADLLNVGLFGTGSVTFGSGNVRETNLRIQGAPRYNGSALKSRKFSVELDGNGIVAAQVDEGAIISNQGSGNITITGRAECLIRKAGFATITCPKDK